jgi:serine/threonine protein kinase
VKIMDFGVARLTTASVTGTGAIVGTADYMSPEQVKGARVDGRSDLFSVGCMFYEMLVGKRPFHAENLMAIFFKITHDDPNWNAIPPGPEYDALTPILSKALAKDLGQRYENATQFALALRDYLATYGTSASAANRAIDDLVDPERPDRHSGPPRRPARRPRHRRHRRSVSRSGRHSGGRRGHHGHGKQRYPRRSHAGGRHSRRSSNPGPVAREPVQPGCRLPRGRSPAPAPEPKSNTTVIAAGFVFLIVTVGGGLYFIANKLDSNKAEPQVVTAPTPVSAPTTAAPATPTPAAVATAAPAPKFESPKASPQARFERPAKRSAAATTTAPSRRRRRRCARIPASTAGQKILDQARNGKDAGPAWLQRAPRSQPRTSPAPVRSLRKPAPRRPGIRR